MDTKGISKLDLKRRNRKQILLAIRRAGMLARVDIAAQLSLTRAAVTIITNQMIAQNILEDTSTPAEIKDEPKKKGRKKTMIRINPAFRYVLGAVVNETSVSIGLADLTNQGIDNRYFEIGEQTKAEEIVQFIVKSCKDLMKKNSVSAKQILGLGVGVVPARWDVLRAEIHDGFATFEKLCYLLEMELSVPVLAESAISLYALAGIDYTDSSTSNQLLVYSGQKFHTVTVYNNELLGGYGKDTSSVDRVVIRAGGAACEGYPAGSVHAEQTRAALLAKAAAATGREMNMDELNAAYDAGDKKVTEIYEYVLEGLAHLIYNLCMVYDVRCVTLQSFRISQKTHDKLNALLLSLSGEENAIQLRFSSVDKNESYRAGSALAIERLFYETGGMTAAENA